MQMQTIRLRDRKPRSGGKQAIVNMRASPGGGVGGGRGGQAWNITGVPSKLGQESQPATRPTGRGARTLEEKTSPGILQSSDSRRRWQPVIRASRRWCSRQKVPREYESTCYTLQGPKRPTQMQSPNPSQCSHQQLLADWLTLANMYNARP